MDVDADADVDADDVGCIVGIANCASIFSIVPPIVWYLIKIK